VLCDSHCSNAPTRNTLAMRFTTLPYQELSKKCQRQHANDARGVAGKIRVKPACPLVLFGGEILSEITYRTFHRDHRYYTPHLDELSLSPVIPAVLFEVPPLLVRMIMPHGEILLHHDSLHVGGPDDVLLHCHMAYRKAAEFSN